MSRPDRLRPLQLPPAELLTDRTIRQAADSYQRLVGEHAEVRKRHDQLVRTRHQEAERDRDAYATAIAEGKDDPGQPHTREHDGQVTEAARREEALEVAVARARASLVEAVERRGPQLVAAAKQREEKAHAALLEAVEKVAEHQGDYAAARALQRWVASVNENGDARWKPSTGGVLPQLRGQGGEPLGFAQVLDALRSFGAQQPTADQRTWGAGEERRAA